MSWQSLPIGLDILDILKSDLTCNISFYLFLNPVHNLFCLAYFNTVSNFVTALKKYSHEYGNGQSRDKLTNETDCVG